MTKNSSFIIVQIVLIVAYPCIKFAPFLLNLLTLHFFHTILGGARRQHKERWGRVAQHAAIRAYANRL